MSKIPKRLSFFIKLLMSLVFVGWLVFRVSWKEVWEIVLGVDLRWIAAYLVLFVVTTGISALKWQVLGKTKDFDATLGGYFMAYLSGAFINNFLPSFIGGDTYRSYWLGKENKRYTAAASTVVFDRMTGLVVAALLALIFSFLNLEKLLSSPLWLGLDLGLLGVLIVFFFWPWLNRVSFLKKAVRVVPAKLRKVISEMDEYREKGAFIPTLAWTLAFHLTSLGLANWILFYALGLAIPATTFLAVIFLISIVASIPVSVNNIGIKEWAYYTFFGLFGISAEVAITAALLGRFLQMVVTLFALFHLRPWRKGGFSFRTKV